MSDLSPRLPQTRAVRLFGLMGNQLFQFALARALTPAGEPVVLEDSSADITLLQSAVKNGEYRVINQKEALILRRAPVFGPRRKAQSLLDIQSSHRLRRFLDRRTYTERAWGQFDPHVAEQPPPVIFKGYFQREEYFLHVADQITASLQPVSRAAQSVFGDASAPLRKTPVVSVHLRAGADYVKLGWNPHYEWFRRGAEAVVTKLGHAGFIIASDVPLAAEAVAADLSDLGPATAMRPAAAYDTMRAISLADHAIVSPGTFSWWAAWLGDHRVGFDPGRLVVAPAVWIDPTMQPASRRWTLLE